MSFGWAASASDRRLLPEGRLAGPMPYVLAIMMFLTVLAAAGGLGLGRAAGALGDDLANRVTVQVIEADPARREAQAQAVTAALAAMPGAEEVERLSDSELATLLAPWLGIEALAADELPVPAMIDITLASPDADAFAELERAVLAAAPGARVDRQSAWLAPIAGLIDALRWLAAGVVALTAIATAACVVLAARAALNTHRATIDVLHLMGANDRQIARLFQRRIALDALFGGLVGLALAVAVILLLGSRIAGLGSELIGGVAMAWTDWLPIALLPIAAAALATLAARVTVLGTLRGML